MADNPDQLKDKDRLQSEVDELKMLLEVVIGHADGMDGVLLERISAGKKLFKAISDTIPVPFVISKREEGEILFGNSRAHDTFGYSAKEFLSKNAFELYKNPDDRRHLLSLLSDNAHVENFEVEMQKADGTVFWASLFSQPLFYQDQDSLLTVVYDLTERKKAEKEKVILERRLQKFEIEELKRENQELKERFFADGLKNPESFQPIITVSKQMLSLFQYAETIARSSKPLLITGETGVGKDLISVCIHHASNRKGKMVTVNIAGFDDNMFSDTLFGHRKGAFTGADQDRAGQIEQAAGGTLLLDEIGDLSPESQVKLLRLLEQNEYIPLGSDEIKRTDARIITATNKNLWELLGERKFREDLIYRLETYHIHVPPLRERKGDIPILLAHFVSEAANELNKKPPRMPQGLVAILSTYPFPGNVRELRNMVYASVSKSESGFASIQSFKTYIDHKQSEQSGSSEYVKYLDSVFSDLRFLPTLKQATDLLVDEAIKRAGGSQTAASRILGVTPQAIHKRLKKRGII